MKKNLANLVFKKKIPLVIYKSLWDAKKGVKMTWMSPFVLESTGFSYTDFESDNNFWWSRVHPDEKNMLKEKFIQLEMGVIDSVEVEYRWLHKNGTYQEFFDQAVVVAREGNKSCEVIGSWANISALKKTERTLAENEEHYKDLVELCPYAIYVQNEGGVAFLNSAAVKLFDAKNPEELIGKSLLNFIHPDYQELARGRIHSLLNERKSAPLVEFKIVTLTGAVKTVEIASTPFIYEGKNASQGVIVDITKRKQSEEYLKTQAEELEQLNRLLLKRQLSMLPAAHIPDQCGVLFDEEKSELQIGDQAVKIQKWSKQYELLKIILKDGACAKKDWQFAEIAEMLDMEGRFEWKKFYNITDAIKKKVAIETGVKDFFFITTQSVKVNERYIEA